MLHEHNKPIQEISDYRLNRVFGMDMNCVQQGYRDMLLATALEGNEPLDPEAIQRIESSIETLKIFTSKHELVEFIIGEAPSGSHAETMFARILLHLFLVGMNGFSSSDRNMVGVFGLRSQKSKRRSLAHELQHLADSVIRGNNKSLYNVPTRIASTVMQSGTLATISLLAAKSGMSIAAMQGHHEFDEYQSLLDDGTAAAAFTTVLATLTYYLSEPERRARSRTNQFLID